MSEHSAGPWRAVLAKSGKGWCVVDAGDNNLTHGGCGCCTEDDDSIAFESDARLIAAAPRMLDALNRFEDDAEEFLNDTRGDEMDQLDAAVKVLMAIRAEARAIRSEIEGA